MKGHLTDQTIGGARLKKNCPKTDRPPLLASLSLPVIFTWEQDRGEENKTACRKGKGWQTRQVVPLLGEEGRRSQRAGGFKGGMVKVVEKQSLGPVSKNMA